MVKGQGEGAFIFSFQSPFLSFLLHVFQLRLPCFFTVNIIFFVILKSAVTPEESKNCLNENSRGLLRISATGFAHCRRGITNLGFTNEECEFLASRQRATNYLFYLYNDKGQPVSRNETRKSSRHLKSSPESAWRVKSAPVETVTKVLIGDKRVCSSALTREKARVRKKVSFRSASFAQRLNQTTMDESLGTIIVRSLNQHLSPSERLERYLLSLQREGYLTSARKDRRKNFDTQLGRELTHKGVMSLRSKFLPHPPVYLFQKGQ